MLFHTFMMLNRLEIKMIKRISSVLLLAVTVFSMALMPDVTFAAKTTSKSKSTSKSTARSASSKKSKKSSPKKASQPTPKPKPVTESELPTVLSSIVSENSVGVVGVSVRRLETGKTIFQHHQNNGFIPASVRKVMTTALALDQLGPEFKYRTFLMRTGAVGANGDLNGDLVILPQGDPTFSSLLFRGTEADWVYRDWVQKVQNQGIKHINGGMKIDCSAWDMDSLKPDWPQRMLNDTYANFPSPLTLKANLMEVIVKPGAPGEPGVVEFRPDAVGYPIVNNTVTGKTGPAFKVSRGANNKIKLSGTINETKTLTLPADNPTLYAAAVFRSLLHKAGITIAGPVTIVHNTVVTPSKENIVAYYESPALKDILMLMNKNSENHLAEQLYVSIGAIRAGHGGYKQTRAIEREFLKRAGVDLNGFYGADGCGLSEATRVSPEQLVQLLSYMATKPYFQVFYDTLPVNGIDGTLKGRMTSVAGKVHAKTGTINGVVTLAGYVTTAEKQTYVFAVLTNKTSRSNGRLLEDRICETLSIAMP